MKLEFRNETQIMEEMVNDAIELGQFSVDDETLEKLRKGLIIQNQYILDLATHSKTFSSIEQKTKQIYEDKDIATATGEALDNLGRLHNVPRIPSKPAMVELNISLPVDSDTDITIPAGTIVIIEEAVTSDQYVTDDELVINAGVTTGTVMASNIVYGFTNLIPAHTVTGLNGFPELTVTNNEDGINGSNGENDDEYRQRVMQWSADKEMGLKRRIENYLLNYDGLDSFKLIPRYDGVGTLKIVCDTIPDLLEQIANDVYENCMVLTDKIPVCVLPDEVLIQELILTVDVGTENNLTNDELTELLKAQTKTFVYGGTRRAGEKYNGMNIGQDFYPSQLLSYLLGEISELINIVCSEDATVPVNDDEVLKLGTITVVINE